MKISALALLVLCFGVYLQAATVTGIVIDADDAGLEGATVRLSPLSGSSVTTTTDADGNYSFTDVDSGMYMITASLGGYANSNGIANVASSDTTLIISFRLSAASSFRGTVTDSTGAAISGADVTLRGSVGGGTVTLVSETDEDGNYAFRSLAVGNYTLTVTMGGYLEYKEQGIHVGAGETVIHDVTLTRGTSVINGTVSDSNGTVLEGAEVTLTAEGSGGLTLTSTTGPDGGYSITGLTAGDYSVSVTLAGYEDYDGNATIETEGDTVDHNIALAEMVTGIGNGLLPVPINVRPGNGCLYVRNVAEPASMVIYSLRGEVLFSRDLMPGDHEVLLHKALSGRLMIVSIKSANREITQFLYKK